MSLPFWQEKAVPLARLVLWLALMVGALSAIAQNNVGELLDAGAKKLSPEEFRQEVVQHTLVGPTPSGARLELMYATSGVIQGRSEATAAGIAIAPGTNLLASLDGAWNVDEGGRICTSMIVQRTILPFRCQYWFKYKDDYFVVDSDSDRAAKALPRTVKQ